MLGFLQWALTFSVSLVANVDFWCLRRDLVAVGLLLRMNALLRGVFLLPFRSFHLFFSFINDDGNFTLKEMYRT